MRSFLHLASFAVAAVGGIVWLSSSAVGCGGSDGEFAPALEDGSVDGGSDVPDDPDPVCGNKLVERQVREEPFRRAALVIDGLRRGSIQHRVAVKQRHLDEHRPRLLRPALAHGAKNALGLAAAQISGHPDG